MKRHTINKQKIDRSNLLFWNLWNVNYLFENFEASRDGYENYYGLFSKLWMSLWTLNDGKEADINVALHAAEKIYPFDDEEYESLNDFDATEASIKEMVTCFENIVLGLRDNERFGSIVHTSPINVIYVILDNEGLGLVQDNMDNPIVLNEMNAQIKLSGILSASGRKYTYQDRNIFR